MSSSNVSQRIRSLYESYPYPPRIEGGSADPYLEYMWSFSDRPHPGQRSFLDAGCGTGLQVLGGAILYPHYQVYGCDLNRIALEKIASERDALGLSNLHLKEMDLLNLDPDFGPPEGFDAIYSTGVIHHTPDPIGILKSMASRLAPQGVLRLLVYGELGRSGLYRFARVARGLYGHLEWPEQIKKARALMEALKTSHTAHHDYLPPVLRGPWQDALTTEDAEFVDRYLNPHDRPFTISTLREAIEEAGLTLLDWFDPFEWDLARLLPDLESSGEIPSDRWQRYSIVERLFDRPKLDLYLVGPDFVPRKQTFSDMDYLGLNPQLFLRCLKTRGITTHWSASLRFGPERPLSSDEGRLLEAFGLRFIPFAGIIQEMPNPDPDHWRPIVESLVEQQYLFYPQPPP